MPSRFPWKGNYQKVPPSVQASLDAINGNLIAVAATKKVSRDDIAAGVYAHVGLRIEDGEVATSGPVSPPADAGKWSERNAFGWDRKRQDWPMV